MHVGVLPGNGRSRTANGAYAGQAEPIVRCFPRVAKLMAGVCAWGGTNFRQVTSTSADRLVESVMSDKRSSLFRSFHFVTASLCSKIARHFTSSVRHCVMSAFESRTQGRSRAVLVLFSILIIGLLAGAYYLWPRFEREPPQVR